MGGDVTGVETMKRAVVLVCTAILFSACVGDGGTATTTETITAPPTSDPASGTTMAARDAPDSDVECHGEGRNPEQPVTFEPADSPVPDGVSELSLDAPVLDIAVGDGVVWVITAATAEVSNRLIGVDAETMEVTGEIQLEDASRLAVRDDLWVTQMWRDVIVRVSPESLSSPSLIRVPPLPPGAALGGVDNCFGPSAIAVTDRGAWFDGRGVVGFANAETGAVTVVLPPNGEISKGGNVVVGFDFVWVESGGGQVWRIDEMTLEWVGGIQVGQYSGHSVSSLTVGPRALWVAGQAFERDADGLVTEHLAAEGGGVSIVDIVDASVIDTVDFDHPLVLASDSQEVMVAWEEEVGLWVFDGATTPTNRRLVACFDGPVGSVAVTDGVAWLGHYDLGQVWKVPLNAISSCPG